MSPCGLLARPMLGYNDWAMMGGDLVKPHDRDFHWLVEHPRELLDRYAGQWLAVVAGRVVAAGPEGEVVYRRAREKYPDAEITIEIVDREPTSPVWNVASLA